MEEVDEKVRMSVYGHQLLTSWSSDNLFIPAHEDDTGISRFFSNTCFTTTVPDRHTIINQSTSPGHPNHTNTNSQNLDFHGHPTLATAYHPDRTSFHPNPKRPRLDNNNHPVPTPPETLAVMKERIYRAAVFRPVDFSVESVERPKRKNIRISNDPQTAAARQRRERISERIRILQKLVPGGSKMDTASMLDEAANYLKFLRAQVRALEPLAHSIHDQTLNGNLNLGLSPIGSYVFCTQNWSTN